MEKIDEQKWKDARLLLQCVAAASRPLGVNELAQFLAFDYGAESIPTFRADRRCLEDPAHIVQSTCSSLLAIVKPPYGLPVVQFAHSSVEEYLTSTRLAEEKDTISRFHVSMTPAHTVVAQACLGLLLHLNESVTKDSLTNFPLAEYAAEYWVGHAQIEGVSSKVQDGMKRLFHPKKSHLSVWVRIYDPGYTYSWDRPNRSEGPEKARATPLHYAVFWGILDVVKFLIVEHSQDVNARGFDTEEIPLHVASRRGHADTARLLLEHGADKKSQNDKKRTPLHLSSQYGHVKVVQLLLEQNAHMEALDGQLWSPLGWASDRGHVDVVRALLQKGADVNSRQGDDLTPLHVAQGEEVTSILLEHHANKDARNSKGQTPLHHASLLGHVGTVRVLLKHGADANARDVNNATPFHLACGIMSGRECADVVRLLLKPEYHSNINAQDDKGQTPFMIATANGEHDIMQLLLVYGADDHRVPRRRTEFESDGLQGQ